MGHISKLKIDIQCPYCGKILEVNRLSFGANGKKCLCGKVINKEDLKKEYKRSPKEPAYDITESGEKQYRMF